MTLVRGARFEITGLVAAAQHNGIMCTLTEFHEDSGRWQVKLDGGVELAVKPQNLTGNAEGGAAADEGGGVQLSLKDIRTRVFASVKSGELAEALRFESKIDELLAGQNHVTVQVTAKAFALAFCGTGQFDKAACLNIRCAEAFEAAGLFDGQLRETSAAADFFHQAGNLKAARVWYRRARDVSMQHGFALLEIKIRHDLHDVLLEAGMEEEALEELRGGMAVVEGCSDRGGDARGLERLIRRDLVRLLPHFGQLEEAESLLLSLGEEEGGDAECVLWNDYLRGELQEFRGNFGAAAEAYRAVVDFAATHPDVLLEDELADQSGSGRQEALDRAESSLRMLGGGWDTPLPAIYKMLEVAYVSQDHVGVLRWESRLDDLVRMTTQAKALDLLQMFAAANYSQDLSAKAAILQERRVDLFGKAERFLDQGLAMCRVGDCLADLEDFEGATSWFERARRLGETWGFYETECDACRGLGLVEGKLGRGQEGEQLLRHALMVAGFVEDEKRGHLEGSITAELTEVLLGTAGYEEAEPLIRRLRELADAWTDPEARVYRMATAMAFGVCLQARRRDVEQARREWEVPPCPQTPSLNKENLPTFDSVSKMLSEFSGRASEDSVKTSIVPKTNFKRKILVPG